MKNTGVLLLLTMFHWYGFSQEQTTVSGYVFDNNTFEPLIGANIVESLSKRGTISNEYGFYSLTVPKSDSATIIVSFIGYKVVVEKLENKDINNFYLTPGLDLGEVTVSTKKGGGFIRKNGIGTIKLGVKQVKQLPNFFGEADIIKALQLTPGIQSGGEAKSNLYVRGGSPDQNLILFDDVPLYYIAHFGGFFSIFNTDAVSDIEMIKGGFPARYGNRLSSVLDIRMKNGNLNKISVQGSIGLMSSKILLEGPIIKEKLSFVVSARKNLVPIFKIMGTGINYGFYDINAKLSYILTKEDKLFLSFYLGDDNVGIKNKLSYQGIKQKDKRSAIWGNKMGSLRWNHVFSKKLFSNTTFAYTSYQYRNGFSYSLNSDSINSKIKSKVTSGINDAILKMDFTWYLNSNYQLRFGQVAKLHRFIPNNEDYFFESNDQITADTTYTSELSAVETAIYCENNFKLKRFGANIGFRFSSYHIKNKNYYSLEPRILLNFIISDNLSIKYSYSRMNQFVHLLSYSGVGMPSDYWMPSNGTVKPEESVQNTFGIYKTLPNGEYEVSLESYYKTMNNLVAFKAGESLISRLNNWTDAVEKGGEGDAYGVELLVQKLTGKTTGWIGATVAKSTREFDNLNNGKPFPFKYDRLFDISIVVFREIKKNITISGTWTYGSGYPVTLATGRYNSELGDVYVYDNINSFRMRDYHRLDLAVNLKAKTSWGERVWTISIFNAYNRRNPYYYYFKRELILDAGPNGPIGSQGNYHLYQKSLFPFFPSVAYSFKF